MPEKGKRVEPNYQAPKPAVGELAANRREFNRVSADFLKVDAATALTFTSIALQTDDAIKKRRNRRAARKAYDTIRKHAKKVELTTDDAQILASDLAALEIRITSLGRNPLGNLPGT